MKRMMSNTVAVAAFAAVLGLVAVPSASAYGSGCSSYSNLQGVFGFTLTGSRVVSGTNQPRAAVGQLTADGRGGLTGSETQSNNGLIVTATETGSYTVNPDCSGTATLTLKGTGVDTTTRTFSFQILHNSQGFLAIVTDAGFIETISAQQMD